MATAQKIIELDFGGDLSASRNSQWVPMVDPDTGAIYTDFALGISWPSGVSGTVAVHVGTIAIGTGVPYITPIPTADQPAGTAAAKFLEGGKTNAPFLIVVFTRTAGSAGQYLSDETARVGAKPRLVLRG